MFFVFSKAGARTCVFDNSPRMFVPSGTYSHLAGICAIMMACRMVNGIADICTPHPVRHPGKTVDDIAAVNANLAIAR